MYHRISTTGSALSQKDGPVVGFYAFILYVLFIIVLSIHLEIIL
jgi:hypothetical protein